MKSKIPIWLKSSVLVLFIFVFFVCNSYLIKHSFLYTTLEANLVKHYYPRYYSFLSSNFDEIIRFIGSNAILFFYINLAFLIVTCYLIIKKNVPNKKDLRIYFFVFIIFLFFAELGLRLVSFKAGFHTNYKYFQPVNELWSYKSYVADENGILKVDPTVTKIISKRITDKTPNYNGREYGEIYCLSEEYLNFKEGKTKNSFFNFYKSIKNKKIKSDFDSSIVHFIDNPINKNGFRSIEFEKYEVNKPTVLLLGDSFTWGHSAMPKTNSFAELLLTKGYVVYNTGISATDVAQYSAIAKKYVKKLNPDFVIVNFYLGNDVNYFKRTVRPFEPVFYCTNAGNIYANYGGKYYDNKEKAYEFVLNQLKIPQKTSFFNYLMAQTAMTSSIWGLMIKTELFPYLQNSDFIKELKISGISKKPYCNIELQEIEALCKVNGSKFILSCIPDVMSYRIKRAKDVPNLFENLNYYEMNVTKSDYNLNDGHFNEIGHRKYAAFLHRIMQSKK